jgi:hypothetical protein
MHFDASGIIYAWDEYPIKNFPPFWKWIETQIFKGECKISQVALDEVGHKYPECAKWLRDKGIEKVRLTDEILKLAYQIKSVLEIDEEAYGSGVDENDLLIIASAKIENNVLLTQEQRQPFDANRKMKNYKIPAVCELDEVSVVHKNVREWILESGEVFI